MANKTNHAPSPQRGKNRRRISVLNILEKQLVSGKRPMTKKRYLRENPGSTFVSSFAMKSVLTDSDRQRIEKQITILKAKIIS